MYGLKTVPSKSCLHHAATIVADYEWLQEIIERQAGPCSILGALVKKSSDRPTTQSTVLQGSNTIY